MAVEVKINDRTVWVELIKQEDSLMEIEVDGKRYEVDLLHTPDGTFSILHNGHSYNIELVPENQPKKYTAYTLYDTYSAEIIDAEARYLMNRNKNKNGSGDNKIVSPMPGKVVKILVEEGQQVKEGETLIIISAMKMESEYKAPRDASVKKIHVQPEQTINSNETLIELE